MGQPHNLKCPDCEWTLGSSTVWGPSFQDANIVNAELTMLCPGCKAKLRVLISPEPQEEIDPGTATCGRVESV